MKKIIPSALFGLLSLLSPFAHAQITKACITIGGSGNDFGNMVRQTRDTGYVMIGYTASFGGTVDDFYIAKFDKNGNVQWSKTIGGANSDAATSIIQTPDGGYVFSGYTISFGAGFDDCYIGRLDENGNFLWGKTIGGGGDEFAFTVQQTADGGYMMGAQTNSFGSGDYDFYIMKLDSGGNLQWSKAIGGSGTDIGYCAIQTSDHGYIMTGKTNGFGTGNDVYVVRLDSTGALQWTKVIVGSDNEVGNSICQTTDGGYAIVGSVGSFGQAYVINLDSLGNILWTRIFSNTTGNSIQQTSDGGYVIVGQSFTIATGSDVCVLKLDASGNLEWTSVSGGSVDDIGNSIQQTFDGGYVIGGTSSSFGAGFDDLYLDKIDSDGNSCCSLFFQTSTVDSGGTETSGGVLTDVTSTVTSPPVNVESGDGTSTATCIISAVNNVSLSRSFFIFPNPNPGAFTVTLPDDFNSATLFVTDIVGRIILRKEISSRQIENSIQVSLPQNISDGIYFLNLKNGTTQSARQVVVEK